MPCKVQRYLFISIHWKQQFFCEFFCDLAKKNAPQHLQFLGKKWENICHFKFGFGHISTTGSSK